MKALVYHGPGQKAWEEVADPTITAPTDAIVRIDATTICGTDLHILKGDVPAVTEGRILGHEGVVTITEVGGAVTKLAVGDRVIISCITSCGSCSYCHQQLPAARFATHHFGLDQMMEAYDTFGRAADTKALKVVIAR